MTKDQLIQIAQAGFPKSVKINIDFNACDMIYWGSVYRLYKIKTPLRLGLPVEEYLSIYIGKNSSRPFIQIKCGNAAFNDYAAIKKMEELGLCE